LPFFLIDSDLFNIPVARMIEAIVCLAYHILAEKFKSPRLSGIFRLYCQVPSRESHPPPLVLSFILHIVFLSGDFFPAFLRSHEYDSGFHDMARTPSPPLFFSMNVRIPRYSEIPKDVPTSCFPLFFVIPYSWEIFFPFYFSLPPPTLLKKWVFTSLSSLPAPFGAAVSARGGFSSQTYSWRVFSVGSVIAIVCPAESHPYFPSQVLSFFTSGSIHPVGRLVIAPRPSLPAFDLQCELVYPLLPPLFNHRSFLFPRPI